MRFTLCAVLPAVVMTLAAIYANHYHPNEPSTIALNLGMFASWSATGFLISLYRVLRIVRRVSQRQSARSARRIEPAPIPLPDRAGAELLAVK